MPLINKLVSLPLYHGKFDCWHPGGKAGEEWNDLTGFHEASNQNRFFPQCQELSILLSTISIVAPFCVAQLTMLGFYVSNAHCFIPCYWEQNVCHTVHHLQGD